MGYQLKRLWVFYCSEAKYVWSKLLVGLGLSRSDKLLSQGEKFLSISLGKLGFGSIYQVVLFGSSLGDRKWRSYC